MSIQYICKGDIFLVTLFFYVTNTNCNPKKSIEDVILIALVKAQVTWMSLM